MAKNIGRLLLMLAFTVTGCAATMTHEQFAKIREGMSQDQVLKAIGQPLAMRRVIFKGHESDYLVWEYRFAPDVPE